ncbi:MAG TPA: hypothetical protein VK973_05925 [Arenicellales bacterium]|nr:hypothetical protein [Arenicellales bacterium]
MIREFIDSAAREGIRRNVRAQERCLQTMMLVPKDSFSYALASFAFAMFDLRIALWQAILPGDLRSRLQDAHKKNPRPEARGSDRKVEGGDD